jgi:hypothetical protein
MMFVNSSTVFGCFRCLNGSIFAMAEVRHEIDELIPRLGGEAGELRDHLKQTVYDRLGGEAESLTRSMMEL